jgi:hypothetical protein
VPRKLIDFDTETLQALELLARDSMRDMQELADEAFRDLLKKHGRPTTLKRRYARARGLRRRNESARLNRSLVTGPNRSCSSHRPPSPSLVLALDARIANCRRQGLLP